MDEDVQPEAAPAQEEEMAYLRAWHIEAAQARYGVNRHFLAGAWHAAGFGPHATESQVREAVERHQARRID